MIWKPTVAWPMANGVRGRFFASGEYDIMTNRLHNCIMFDEQSLMVITSLCMICLCVYCTPEKQQNPLKKIHLTIRRIYAGAIHMLV